MTDDTALVVREQDQEPESTRPSQEVANTATADDGPCYLARRILAEASIEPVRDALAQTLGSSASRFRTCSREDLIIDGLSMRGALLLPMLDAARQIVNFAFIASDRRIHYLPGGQVDGCWYGWGSNRDTIIVAGRISQATQLHE